MLLSSLLDAEFVKMKVNASSKQEIIELLLDEIYAHYHFQLSRDEILKAILARESLKGTVFPSGIAIPHARIELFNDILIGIASPAKPILEDGIEVKLVVLILTSKTTSNLYLNCLAAFTRLSLNTAFFGKLGECTDGSEALSLISSEAIEVKPELAVEHIMTRNMVTVGPGQTVREIIDIMVEKDLTYVPVVGPNGSFLGEISVLDILKLGIPNYAQMIGNINFLRAFEPLEELLAQEDSIFARDVMEPPGNSFTPDTSIVEAVFAFTKTKKRHIPVVDSTQIIGIVSYMDILNKVLRA